MLRGLWRLTWIELKIFWREPLGLLGAVGVPVLVFVVLAGVFEGEEELAGWTATGLPVFAALLITIAAVLSLITIIAIYRDGGILRRLRATPLHPLTILSAHVLVKLILTLVTLALLALAGKTWGLATIDTGLLSFAGALVYVTVCILSLGFLIASLVPTARFAQPLGSVLLYPMLAVSGLFQPLADLPPLWRTILRLQPMTHAVILLESVWTGEGWLAAAPSVAYLAVFFAVMTAISARVFRWE